MSDDYEAYLGRTENGKFFVETHRESVARRLASDEKIAFFSIIDTEDGPELVRLAPSFQNAANEDFETVDVVVAGKSLGTIRRMKPSVKAAREEEARNQAQSRAAPKPVINEAGRT